MDEDIRVAILDNYQTAVDCYTYRLGAAPGFRVLGAAAYAAELEPLLAAGEPEVLLAEAAVPYSARNPNPCSLLGLLPRLRQGHPGLRLLVISAREEAALIRALLDNGASGYILKGDRSSILELPRIVALVRAGAIYLSAGLDERLKLERAAQPQVLLSSRQLEVLALCAADPDCSTGELARALGISSSTARNLLSGAYQRLGVHTRAAALEEARRLGLLLS